MNKKTQSDDRQITNKEQRRFFELATAARTRWDWDAAETFYNKAIEAAPGNAKMYMFRGAMHCVKAQSIKDRDAYLEALKPAVSDYRKAYALDPNDPEIGISLMETEVLTGSASIAALHLQELFPRIKEPLWLGICSWLGAVTCVLAGQSEKNWQQFREHLPLAANCIAAKGWNPDDIEKYLIEYAEEDVPSERVKTALEIHRSVVKSSFKSNDNEHEADKKDSRLWRLLSEMSMQLTDDQAPISFDKIRHVEDLFAHSNVRQNEDEQTFEDLAAARKEFQRIMLRQGMILSTKAETASDIYKEDRGKLYFESLKYMESAVHMNPREMETKDSVITVFRKCAAFLAMENRDAVGAVQVVEKALSLYPDDKNLGDLLRSVKRLVI